MAKLLHMRKRLSILLKVDIAKAFNTVGWAFLLELLQHLRFSLHWCNWISNILSTASTQILLNGSPSQRICHARGLRQGDPLSPLLFILSMEALNGLLYLAVSRGVSACASCSSLYADDLIIFLVPTTQDITLVWAILNMFAGASELHMNVAKCQFMPISSSEDQIDIMQSWFPCQLVHFPCRYLGVALSVHKLKKAELQPLVDTVADRLPTWKVRLMSKAGRTTLTKVTLSSISIHVSIAVALSPWLLPGH
jgi:hypothetical protein